MSNAAEVSAKLEALVAERMELEGRLQRSSSEADGTKGVQYELAYARLQRALAQLFGASGEEEQRTTIMLEIMRILENKLVYLHNFSVDPTSDNRMLATLVDRFIGDLLATGSTVLTSLEATYYRAIAALYAGDRATAREAFLAACASEESDEANDIKYKSYVMLGNLSHEEHDYARARELHDASLRYSANENVTAQALAFKALNAYALKEYDEALALFERALALFDRDAPFFNSYFHRNALIFSGAIHHGKRSYEKAAACYRAVLEEVEESSYDYFDALVQLGRTAYLRGRWDEAAEAFDRAIAAHRFQDNESLMDSYYWLAKARIKQGRSADARACLERIAGSAVSYENRPKAVELLARVG